VIVVSGDRESMVVRRHEDGALEIVSQGTETQLISRDLLAEMVASLNQNLAEIERLRAAGDALAKSLAEFNDPEDGLRLLAWQEARRERQG
jgi:hypothetical protein